MRLYWIVLRSICYLGLLFVASGVGALALVHGLGGCPTLATGETGCTGPFYQAVYDWGVSVLVITAFKGLPGLLALGGLVFLVRDSIALIRHRRAAG